MSFIELVISPQGQSQVQTKGYGGADCRAASQFLQQALGQTSHEQLTAEFHQGPVSRQAAESEHN